MMSIVNKLHELEEDYSSWLKRSKNKDIILSRAERKLHNASHGITVCKGPELCPFYHICPVAEQDEYGNLTQLPDEEYPVNSPCLAELMFYRQCLASYISSLGIDEFNYIEIKMAQELAMVDLEKYRARNILAAGDKEGQGRDLLMTHENVVQVGDAAVTVAQTVLHPLVDLLDRLDKRHSRIASKFMATRRDIMEMKAKLGGASEQNKLTQQLAQLSSVIEKLSEQNLLLQVETDRFND